jgi:hypothetical protein
MGTIATKPQATRKPSPTHREITPIRECVSCGAYLRSYKYGDKCDPCEKGDLEQPITEADVWDAMAEGDTQMRRALADGILELMENAA